MEQKRPCCSTWAWGRTGGLVWVERAWPLEVWASGPGSETLALSSDIWLQWESATEGRLPLSEGAGESRALECDWTLRRSRRWASASSRVSFICIPPPLQPLPPLFLLSFPFCFLPDKDEDDEDEQEEEGSLGQWAEQQGAEPEDD